jgi:FixJ family two-component response regulator
VNRAPTVFAVDDDLFMRFALESVLTSAGIAVETYASAPELLARADLSAPAILLLDVMMPGMSGLELQMLLRDRRISLPVIFLTGLADIPMAVAAMRNGAVDFLEKPFDSATLIGRIRQAFERVGGAAPRSMREKASDYVRRRASLTPREAEVIALMLVGKSSKEIARALGGSSRTIEAHRASVMSKMAAANLADLIRMTFAGAQAA